MYIAAASSISVQQSFRNPGYTRQLQPVLDDNVVVHPDYASFIPAMDRRRMSDVLKMSVTCSKDCMEQTDQNPPDAIIVGTSMGCCQNIRSFLDTLLENESGLISPTAFISSTHNTIAGQISLALRNNSYNMTHTQNSLSFEHALADAMLALEEGMSRVLVGGADEAESNLFDMHTRLGAGTLVTGSGSSFFMLRPDKHDQHSVRIRDVGCYGLVDDIKESVAMFLSSASVDPESVDMVFCGDVSGVAQEIVKEYFPRAEIVDYIAFTGTFLTASAAAVHAAADRMMHPEGRPAVSRILICNHLIPENLGLILLENPGACD